MQTLRVQKNVLSYIFPLLLITTIVSILIHLYIKEFQYNEIAVDIDHFMQYKQTSDRKNEKQKNFMCKIGVDECKKMRNHVVHNDNIIHVESLRKLDSASLMSVSDFSTYQSFWSFIICLESLVVSAFPPISSSSTFVRSLSENLIIITFKVITVVNMLYS